METEIEVEVEPGNNPEPIGRATYSPEDNKLRLYPEERLDAETYKRVKAMGFGWAPVQKFFVASAWTPGRFDLLVDLCGEVGDEETTLAERAEERAERFSRYKANRHRDAHTAADRVAGLTEHIPLGQPILIGHHSQRAAERQAKKIERAMETAVDQWSRHEYWTRRIPAVLAHAEFKADEALRHRRIKGLESDLRKQEKEVAELELQLSKWNRPNLSLEHARHFANYSPYGTRLNCVKSPNGDHYYSAYDVLQPDEERYATCPAMTVVQVVEIANKQLPYRMTRIQRWIDHLNLRLSYERELMEQAGGDMRERHDFKVGGKVKGGRRASGEWLTILRVNKSGGKVNSLTTTTPIEHRHWRGSQQITAIETVTEYQPPIEGEEVKVKAVRRKPAPLTNYESPGCEKMTEAQYLAIPERHREFYTVRSTDTHLKHRHRRAWLTNPEAYLGGDHKLVYLSDKKTVMPPVKVVEPVVVPEPLPVGLQIDLDRVDAVDKPAPLVAKGPNVFDAMRDTLKGGGVQIAVAHQLFPTPMPIAARMVELAEIENGMCVLEPSAGTGNLVQAIRDKHDTEVLAYEINYQLCSGLRQRFQPFACHVEQGDFLEVEQKFSYRRILMNPPFENGSDIKHILRALDWLDDGGRLVGICANGPRQQDKIMPLCTSWEELPSGTFEGTGVRTALFVIDK